MLSSTLAATTTAVALTLTLGACGSGGDDEEPRAERETGRGTAGVGSAAEHFGPGCSDFPSKGGASLDAMADQPFATAITGSPVLGRLSDALKRAGLDGELDAVEDMTVFAPTNEAFDMYPDQEIDDLLANPDGLAYLLTYHVVAGRVGSAELEGGVFDALNGGRVRTSGTTGEYTVDDYSPVVCADVRTANATVHVVDMLLLPS
ncbi:fasciclin domain-containing protein [Nocardiopsis sp. NPDC058789]|uniref:fasciclin domain-containing protein n=1 Tax=Nocardiopsis sp. NPDC058789 TaxID=3346634 RepID=UPI00366B8098